MADFILVSALGPKNRDDADEKKHRYLGHLCAKFSICCHHASLVYCLPFDFACDLL